MRDQIIIRMPSDGNSDVVQWIKLGDSILTPSVKQGSLKDIVEEIAGAKVIVLAPSNQVLLTYVSIPTTNKQRLLKAIPYALEEELASDVEQLHFAAGAVDDSGKTPVAVIEKNIMNRWQEKFSETGLNVDTIVPEVLALPLLENSWSILVEESGMLIRAGLFDGYGIDSDNIEFVLPLTIAKAEQPPTQLTIYSLDGATQFDSFATDEIEIVHQQNQRGLLWLLASEGIDTQNAINLLQGGYSQREQLGKLWRPWRFAASLAGVWFVLQLTVAITQSAQLETQSADLKAEIEQIYKDAFPDAKRIVKPRVQMQQKLVELKNGGNTVSKISFLNLLSDSGKAFNQTSGLVLRSARYKNGVLDVEIDVPNLQALDRLKQQLAENKGMSVEIQSAASRNNKVQGRLQIKGQAS